MPTHLAVGTVHCARVRHRAIVGAMALATSAAHIHCGLAGIRQVAVVLLALDTAARLLLRLPHPNVLTVQVCNPLRRCSPSKSLHPPRPHYRSPLQPAITLHHPPRSPLLNLRLHRNHLRDELHSPRPVHVVSSQRRDELLHHLRTPQPHRCPIVLAVENYSPVCELPCAHKGSPLPLLRHQGESMISLLFEHRLIQRCQAVHYRTLRLVHQNLAAHAHLPR
ncbi:hypothetical protein DFH08DRAFT_70903 [Mycena albidolilacea]|uniref:Uncharacterized protein n=1 Tax=Mycena albidolilacea TaxID=1033008 RepID=A0AAD6Z1K5_9AGAR|nr:hypothetical protein DFH08DRAFT_70903 [Mycena albidolilacea]